jgi:hypothetical protein
VPLLSALRNASLWEEAQKRPGFESFSFDRWLGWLDRGKTEKP